MWQRALDGIVAIGGPRANEVLKAAIARAEKDQQANEDFLEWLDEARDQVLNGLFPGSSPSWTNDKRLSQGQHHGRHRVLLPGLRPVPPGRLRGRGRRRLRSVADPGEPGAGAARPCGNSLQPHRRGRGGSRRPLPPPGRLCARRAVRRVRAVPRLPGARPRPGPGPGQALLVVRPLPLRRLEGLRRPLQFGQEPTAGGTRPEP